MAEGDKPAKVSIRSRDDLHTFLDGRTQDECVQIAVRAAWRTFPFLLNAPTGFESRLMLTGFRATLVTQRGRGDAVYAASDAVSDEGDSAGDAAYAAITGYAAADAAYAAAAAAYAAIASDAASDASSSVAYAAYATAHKVRLWLSVEADCQTLVLERGSLWSMTLWPLPELATAQQTGQALRRDLQEMGELWPLLADWYDQILQNAAVDPFPIKALDDLTNESSEFWGDGDNNPRTPDVVMADIAERLGWFPSAEQADQDVLLEEPASQRDFFISYSSHDEKRARDIVDILTKNGYSAYAQFKDFPPGSNFVAEMNAALAQSNRLIALYSPAYWKSDHCQAEWSHAYNADPGGKERRVIGLVVRTCAIPPLATQIVWKNLMGLSDKDTERAVLTAIETEARPQTAQQMLMDLTRSASPQAKLDTSQRLDAEPNPVFDIPIADADLPDLPELLIENCGALLAGAPGNCPKAMRHSLARYQGHLEKNGINCSAKILSTHGVAIMAGFQGEDAEPWMGGALGAHSTEFIKHHQRLITHYPLNEDSERIMAETPVDLEQAQGSALSEPLEIVLDSADSLQDAGQTTEDFDKVIEDIRYGLEDLQNRPGSSEDGSAGVKRAGRRKRFVLITLGFFSSALGVAASSTALAATSQGVAFISALKTAIETLLKFIAL